MNDGAGEGAAQVSRGEVFEYGGFGTIFITRLVAKVSSTVDTVAGISCNGVVGESENVTMIWYVSVVSGLTLLLKIGLELLFLDAIMSNGTATLFPENNVMETGRFVP